MFFVSEVFETAPKEFKNELQEAMYEFISSDTVKGIVDLGTSLVSILENIAEVAGPVFDSLIQPLTEILTIISNIVDATGALGAGVIGTGGYIGIKAFGRDKMLSLNFAEFYIAFNSNIVF